MSGHQRIARPPTRPNARRWAAMATALLLSASMFGLPETAHGAGDPHASLDRSDWVGRIQNAREQVHSAQNLYVTAMLSYRQMRHRRRIRGDEKLVILTLQKAAQNKLAAAEDHLAQVLEQARRAGVPPGWVRNAMDEQNPAAPAN